MRILIHARVIPSGAAIFAACAVCQSFLVFHFPQIEPSRRPHSSRGGARFDRESWHEQLEMAYETMFLRAPALPLDERGTCSRPRQHLRRAVRGETGTGSVGKVPFVSRVIAWVAPWDLACALTHCVFVHPSIVFGMRSLARNCWQPGAPPASSLQKPVRCLGAMTAHQGQASTLAKGFLAKEPTNFT